MNLIKNILNLVCCKILYRVKYVNLEKIKNVKRCLICPNHSNVLDPVFIYTKTDNLYIMAKSDLFKNKLIRWLLLKYNIFPTNREKVDFKSLYHSLEIFNTNNEERKLLMFPEGRVIKKKEDIGKYYRKGAVYISANCNIPIIPVYITMRPHFFSKVTVTFGEPIYIKKEELNSKQEIENKSKMLIQKIYELNNERGKS